MITFTYSNFGKTAESYSSPLGYGAPAGPARTPAVPVPGPGVSPRRGSAPGPPRARTAGDAVRPVGRRARNGPRTPA
jgi:hypothetical protein